MVPMSGPRYGGMSAVGKRDSSDKYLGAAAASAAVGASGAGLAGYSRARIKGAGAADAARRKGLDDDIVRAQDQLKRRAKDLGRATSAHRSHEQAAGEAATWLNTGKPAQRVFDHPGKLDTKGKVGRVTLDYADPSHHEVARAIRDEHDLQAQAHGKARHLLEETQVANAQARTAARRARAAHVDTAPKVISRFKPLGRAGKTLAAVGAVGTAASIGALEHSRKPQLPSGTAVGRREPRAAVAQAKAEGDRYRAMGS